MDYQIPFSQLCFLSTELILYVILILIILRQLFTEFLCRLSSSRTWSKFMKMKSMTRTWISDHLFFRSLFIQRANPCYCSSAKFIFLKICLAMYAIQVVFVPVSSGKNCHFSWWLLFILSTSFESELTCSTVIFCAALVSNLLTIQPVKVAHPFALFFAFFISSCCFLSPPVLLSWIHSPVIHRIALW